MKRFWTSRWRDSILLVPLLTVAWWVYGSTLGDEVFSQHFSHLAVLTDMQEIFGYLGLLFAIQIPVLILLLEKMYDSGYVRRLSLPSVISFREILTSYVVLGFLILFSPQPSFYYFPVVGLTLLSVYAIVESVRVMFESRQIKQRENRHIKKLIQKYLKESMRDRKSTNDFFARLKESPYVTHDLFDLDTWHENKNMNRVFPIRSHEAGVVESIDIDKLNNLIVHEYYDGQAPNASVRLVLSTRPRAKVEKESVLIKLDLPSDLKIPSGRLEHELLDCIKITPISLNSPNKRLDALVSDCERQLRDAIVRDDKAAVDDALEVYDLLADGLAELHSSEDPGYSFEAAQNEFTTGQLFDDGFSRRLESIASIMDKAFALALRKQHQDIIDSIISSMYHSILREFDHFDVLTVVRAETTFDRAINKLVSSDDRMPPEAHYREAVMCSLTLKLREHTNLLLYKYRRHDESMSFSKTQLIQWLEMRLHSLSGSLRVAYSQSKPVLFKFIISVFDGIEKEHDLYGERIVELVQPVRCTLSSIATDITSDNKKSPTSEQKEIKKIAEAYLQKFTPKEKSAMLNDDCQKRA